MASPESIGPAALAAYAPGAAFGPRQLLEFELVWIIRGSLEWTIHNTPGGRPQQHVLRPGQLAFSRQGAVDSYQWDRHSTTVHGYIHFELAESSWPSPSVPSVREMSEVPLYAPLCDYLTELGGLAGPEAWARTDQLLAVLFDLYLAGGLSDPVSDLPPVLLEIQSEVRRRWDRDGWRIIGADELAAAVGMSTGHLFRLFREQLGMGPAQALELIRLSRAATMLQRSNSTLADVARTCGFANPYHLSRRFSAAYGMPPGQFRRTPSRDPLGPVRSAGLQSFAYVMTPR